MLFLILTACSTLNLNYTNLHKNILEYIYKPYIDDYTVKAQEMAENSHTNPFAAPSF